MRYITTILLHTGLFLLNHYLVVQYQATTPIWRQWSLRRHTNLLWDPAAPTPSPAKGSNAAEGAAAAAATAATGTANAFQAIQLPAGQVANTSGLHSGISQTSSARDAVRLALIEGYAGNAEALNKVLSNLDEALANRTPAVSTVKSTTKSHPPATFHGHASDHGHAAQSWLYSVQLYYQAENEHNPVAKVATYLREHALDWWQQLGSKTLPLDANFTAFSEAFLARYVKPSDSQKARKELPTLRQSDNESVETEVPQNLLLLPMQVQEARLTSLLMQVEMQVQLQMKANKLDLMTEEGAATVTSRDTTCECAVNCSGNMMLQGDNRELRFSAVLTCSQHTTRLG